MPRALLASGLAVFILLLLSALRQPGLHDASGPASAAPLAGDLVVFELYGSDSCPACRAAKRAALKLASEHGARMLMLEAEYRTAPAERISRWWAACGEGERVWLPLAMTDSGFQCWAPPTTRAPDWREVFQPMIDATLGRPADVAVSATWTPLQRGRATANVRVTNVGSAVLHARDKLTLHLITAERASPTADGLRVHRDKTVALDDDLEPGESIDIDEVMQLPAGVPVPRIEVVVLVDHRPVAAMGSYRLLGAALASSSRPTATAVPSATATPSPEPTATVPPGTVPPRTGGPDDPWPRLQNAARSANPYYVTTRFTYRVDGEWGGDHPAVVAFRDTPPGRPWALDNVLVLATNEQTGTTFGLARDVLRDHVYASAFHLPAGFHLDGLAGAIYRIDLRTDSVTRWATIDAGPDLLGGADASARALAQSAVGRTSLGDIDLDHDGRVLFVMNLHDRRVHRLSVPDGQPLGSFAHGAASEPWAANARPFGLGWHDGWLFHGVVDSRQDRSLPGSLAAYVYRSRADGSQMAQVANVHLDYPRQPPWVPWSDGARDTAEIVAQPMFTDIEFRPNGDLILGLRDRLLDAVGVFTSVPPNGDLLPAIANGPDRWTVSTEPEHYEDHIRPTDGEPSHWTCDECTTGTMARVPGRDAVVASMRKNANDSSGALWFDAATGIVQGPNDGIEVVGGEWLHGGDVESLGLPGATLYLPMAQRDLCSPRPPADVTLVIDASTTMLRRFARGQRRLDVAITAAGRLVDGLSMSDGLADVGPRLLSHDQLAVVGFHGEAWVEGALTTDHTSAHAALNRLSDHVQEGSRLDRGLRVGHDAATSDWSRRLARRVVILLTDGWINRVPPGADGRPETTVLNQGRALRDAGIELIVIGIGEPDEVYGPLLQELAGQEWRYFGAGDDAALNDVFASLARRFRCRPTP